MCPCQHPEQRLWSQREGEWRIELQKNGHSSERRSAPEIIRSAVKLHAAMGDGQAREA